MKRIKLDQKAFKTISVDIARMEKKHGRDQAHAAMKRYLTREHERAKRHRAITQLRSELVELEGKA